MTREEPRQHIAIIIPKNRTWLWHDSTISRLRRDFRVSVYTSAKAPRYPLTLRFWIRLESFVLGEDLVKSKSLSAPPWVEADSSDYAFILNLSDAPIGHHGNCVVEPRFGGRTDSLNLFAMLFAHQNPYISFHVTGQDEQPITASYLAIQDRIVLSRSLKLSFARLSALAERTVHHLTQNTRAAILPSPKNVLSTYSKMGFWLFCLRFFIDKLFFRFLRKCQFREHWSVALLQLGRWQISDGVPLKDLFILPDDGKRYYADPFLFAHNGQEWLFVEEYDYRTKKGIISCSPISKGSKKIDVPTPVLARPYHLSYPFVFRHRNEIYLIPETGSNSSVELYHARSFPLDWTLIKILLNDVKVYEVTLLWHQDIWWMFAAVAHEGGSAQDELAIFYSQSLEGPWHPHQLNPVKSDCRSARPAGNIIRDGERLLRPAQDCESSYGSSLVWLEILELTPSRFKECEVARWPGSIVMNAQGAHTFNSCNAVGVIDFRRTLWRRPFSLRKVRDKKKKNGVELTGSTIQGQDFE